MKEIAEITVRFTIERRVTDTFIEKYDPDFYSPKVRRARDEPTLKRAVLDGTLDNSLLTIPVVGVEIMRTVWEELPDESSAEDASEPK